MKKIFFLVVIFGQFYCFELCTGKRGRGGEGMAFCFSGLFCPRGVLLESALSGSFQHLVAPDTVGIYIHTWFMMSPYFLRKYESAYIVLYFLSFLHLLVLRGRTCTDAFIIFSTNTIILFTN